MKNTISHLGYTGIIEIDCATGKVDIEVSNVPSIDNKSGQIEEVEAVINDFRNTVNNHIANIEDNGLVAHNNEAFTTSITMGRDVFEELKVAVDAADKDSVFKIIKQIVDNE